MLSCSRRKSVNSAWKRLRSSSVAVLVDLLADLLARLERHQDELEIFAGIEDAAEILIGGRRLFDIVDITLHRRSSFALVQSFSGSRPQFMRE
jgi:hypothetical protein